MRRTFLALIILLVVPVRALAGEAEVRLELKSLYNNPAIPFDAFSATFRSQVPDAALKSAIADLRNRYGTASRVTGTDGSYVLWTSSYRIPTKYSKDASGKVATLFFNGAVPVAANLAEVAGKFDALPGDVSYVITRNGKSLIERNAGKAYAVGSAFKLGVLSILREQIEAGRRSWRDVVNFKAHHRSLPSGILQKLPIGSPLTLHTLAALMMSWSDNTATDILMDVVGRGAVNTRLGMEHALTTREFFALKADDALAQRYNAAAPADRKAIAAQAARRPLPDIGKVSRPHQSGVEWYMSLEKLCALADTVFGLSIAKIEPGFVDPSNWQDVIYKGGSEIGVRNHTTLMEDKKGNRFCVAATWNRGEALGSKDFDQLYASLFPVLIKGP